MSKTRANKPHREVTKHQLSHWEQQKKRQRFIFITGVSIIAAALIIVGIGWYFSLYKPMNQTVIRVNDTSFNMSYYIKMLKYYGKDSPDYYMTYVASQVVSVIQQNELITQNAGALGISISDDEVENDRKSRNPPLSKDYRDMVRAEILTKKLLSDYFDPQVPASAEQRHIIAMLLESESQASEVRARLEAGENFAELADELSLDSYSKSNEGDFDWRPKDILPLLVDTPVLEEQAFTSETDVLSLPIYDAEKTKNVGYWIVKVLERGKEDEEGTDHIQAILLGSEEEASEVRARLEAGEDFAELAKELSQHTTAENGGDLGWLSPGMIGSPVDDFAFNDEIEPGTLSEPLRDEAFTTKGGYWLFKVLGIEEREIAGENRDILKANLFEEWVKSLWDNPENIIESYLDGTKIAWALERV